MGFMLAHEEFPVAQLIELGIATEQAGFDLLATSDHLQPWQANEGHSGAAWATMGALSQRTNRVPLRGIGDSVAEPIKHIAIQRHCIEGSSAPRRQSVGLLFLSSWHLVFFSFSNVDKRL